MIGLLLYVCGCTVVAFVVSFLRLLLIPTRDKMERSSGLTILGFVLLSLALPFAYVEVLTRSVGTHLEDAVDLAFERSPVQGRLAYFRVVAYNGNSARALLIAEEKNRWGATDRPVMTVALHRKGEDWYPDPVEVVSSDRLNLDGVAFPPYR